MLQWLPVTPPSTTFNSRWCCSSDSSLEQPFWEPSTILTKVWPMYQADFCGWFSWWLTFKSSRYVTLAAFKVQLPVTLINFHLTSSVSLHVITLSISISISIFPFLAYHFDFLGASNSFFIFHCPTYLYIHLCASLFSSLLCAHRYIISAKRAHDFSTRKQTIRTLCLQHFLQSWQPLPLDFLPSSPERQWRTSWWDLRMRRIHSWCSFIGWLVHKQESKQHDIYPMSFTVPTASSPYLTLFHFPFVASDCLDCWEHGELYFKSMDRYDYGNNYESGDNGHPHRIRGWHLYPLGQDTWLLGLAAGAFHLHPSEPCSNHAHEQQYHLHMSDSRSWLYLQSLRKDHRLWRSSKQQGVLSSERSHCHERHSRNEYDWLSMDRFWLPRSNICCCPPWCADSHVLSIR